MIPTLTYWCPNELKSVVNKFRDVVAQDPEIYSYLKGENELSKETLNQKKLGSQPAGLFDSKVVWLNSDSKWLFKVEKPPLYPEGSGSMAADSLPEERFNAVRIKMFILSQNWKDFCTPKKYLVKYSSSSSDNTTTYGHGAILSEKIEHLNKEETLQAWSELEESKLNELANKICQLIQQVPEANLTLDNFAVLKEDRSKIAIFSTGKLELSKKERRWTPFLQTRLSKKAVECFYKSLEPYLKAHPNLKTMKQVCERNIKAIKATERKKWALLIAKILSCLLILPIPFYLYQRLKKR